MRDPVKSVLEKRGHELITREDANVAGKYAQYSQVDTVITDINTPETGGLDLTSQFRNLP